MSKNKNIRHAIIIIIFFFFFFFLILIDSTTSASLLIIHEFARVSKHLLSSSPVAVVDCTGMRVYLRLMIDCLSAPVRRRRYDRVFKYFVFLFGLVETPIIAAVFVCCIMLVARVRLQ
uniref:Uncharacterized protein n=1 Tax=Schizaphis graminum TaxID=13262 RepID=A0A2S2NTH5_SCHGA